METKKMILNKTVEIEIDRGEIVGVAIVNTTIRFKEDVTMVPYMEGNIAMRTKIISAIRIDWVTFVDEDQKQIQPFQLFPDEIARATFEVERRI